MDLPKAVRQEKLNIPHAIQSDRI